ncbi:hypothetical protein EDD18DRAFT_1364461 [Armillaria luteobubalina]|uniref:Uncharacterized protein n=1 Tax=Armillaria luteobubalina TaxID=153913 RepID=A0AA39P7H3_9AGAR|nr:hypothetical protein EDD18DRAFT_1364461 [Armillaria luteobubalina]
MQRFFPQIIDYTLEDRYWIKKFPFHATSDELNSNVIAYGLGMPERKSDIVMLQNPYNSENKSRTETQGWNEVILTSLWFPVPMVYADISENGYNNGNRSLCQF